MNNYLITNLLNRASIKLLFSMFDNNKHELRLVGGCIRDALIGKETRDIDVAANMEIDKVIEILNKYKIKAHREDNLGKVRYLVLGFYILFSYYFGYFRPEMISNNIFVSTKFAFLISIISFS